jgi:hypothetical protein
MKTDGIIYVQVPHQRKAQAFTFASPEEFIQFLRNEAPQGFSYRNFTREEWMAEAHGSGNDEGSDWWNKWIVPGIELFDAGADQIAEIWHNECNRELIPDPAKHDEEEFSALFSAVNDFNSHYSLGHDEAVRILKIGPSALHHTHQQYEAFRAIEKAADDLGWWHEPQYKYQIYCDRGKGPELDGCWGSEHAIFDTEEEAEEAIEKLKEGYPDVEWLWKREEVVEDHRDYDEQGARACLDSEG